MALLVRLHVHGSVGAPTWFGEALPLCVRPCHHKVFRHPVDWAAPQSHTLVHSFRFGLRPEKPSSCGGLESPNHKPMNQLWVASAGARIGRNRCIGDNDKTLLVDPYQWPLTHSSSGMDHVAAIAASLASRWRNIRHVCTIDQSVCPPGGSKNNGPWLSFSRFSSMAFLLLCIKIILIIIIIIIISYIIC
jgi:hypothetical protein